MIAISEFVKLFLLSKLNKLERLIPEYSILLRYTKPDLLLQIAHNFLSPPTELPSKPSFTPSNFLKPSLHYKLRRNNRALSLVAFCCHMCQHYSTSSPRNEVRFSCFVLLWYFGRLSEIVAHAFPLDILCRKSLVLHNSRICFRKKEIS